MRFSPERAQIGNWPRRQFRSPPRAAHHDLTESIELLNAEVTTKLSRLPALPCRIRQARLHENAAVVSNKSLMALKGCSGEMPHVRSRHRSDRISVPRCADRGGIDRPCRRLSPLRPRPAHHEFVIPRQLIRKGAGLKDNKHGGDEYL